MPSFWFPHLIEGCIEEDLATLTFVDDQVERSIARSYDCYSTLVYLFSVIVGKVVLFSKCGDLLLDISIRLAATRLEVDEENKALIRILIEDAVARCRPESIVWVHGIDQSYQGIDIKVSERPFPRERGSVMANI